MGRAMTRFPTCIKRVEASRIISWRVDGDDIIVATDDGPRTCSRDLFVVGEPAPGDYLVYELGDYPRWIPRGAFLLNYRADPEA
jgi:hypothetical protein